MQKIPTLFQRNFTDARRIDPILTPGTEWVQAGEGEATEKIDGTCCLIQDGKLFKRFDAKAGKQPPGGFVPAQPDPDPVTGHWPGWLLVGDGPDDQWHRDAWEHVTVLIRETGGTYELIGPKIQGNPYQVVGHHLLMRHGSISLQDAPVTYDGLREYLARLPIEGIVWWHPDGRKAKIKRRDFGFPWPDPKPPRPPYGWCMSGCGRPAGSYGQLCDECRAGQLEDILLRHAEGGHHETD